jgi:DNA polymerase III subunit delta'
MWQTAGQEQIINYLRDSIERGAMAHAYLFVGPAHIGKMTLALELASALNCDQEDPPCKLCRVCRRIEQGKHPDVIVIDKNSGRDAKDRKKATEIGIDTIRETLQRGANLPPYEGRYKIFIIDNADLMSTEASNCLLKTLEEPPQHIVILLLTSEEKALLQTVVSRCQRFELKPVPTVEIEKRLSLVEGADQVTVKLLARLAGGCLGWALTAVNDTGYLQTREQRLCEFSSLLTKNWDDRLSYILHFPSDRSGAEETIKLWLLWCRDVMLLKYNCEDAVTHIDKLNDIRTWANMLTVLEIKDFIDSLNKMLIYLSHNANLHLIFEVLMLDMPRKEKRADYALNPAGADR